MLSGPATSRAKLAAVCALSTTSARGGRVPKTTDRGYGHRHQQLRKVWRSGSPGGLFGAGAPIVYLMGGSGRASCGIWATTTATRRAGFIWARRTVVATRRRARFGGCSARRTARSRLLGDRSLRDRPGRGRSRCRRRSGRAIGTAGWIPDALIVGGWAWRARRRSEFGAIRAGQLFGCDHLPARPFVVWAGGGSGRSPCTAGPGAPARQPLAASATDCDAESSFTPDAGTLKMKRRGPLSPVGTQ